MKIRWWAEATAEATIQPVLDSGVELGPGWVESAWDQLSQVKTFNPFDRTAIIKVVRGQMYVVAHSSVDPLPGGMQVKAWLRDLMRLIGWLLKYKRNVPDFEALFTCSARADDIADLLPGVIVLSHCVNSTRPDRIVAIPRAFAMFFYKDVNVLRLEHDSRKFEKRIMNKIPKAVFRGALSGPARVPLFVAAHTGPHHDLLDVGLTTLPMGAPCMNDSSRWCSHAPREWAEAYSLTLVPPMSPSDQARYRYLVVVDGVGCADRLETNRERYFAGDAVLLWARTSNSEFWYRDMQPWEHYIPLQPDFSDLGEKVALLNRNKTLVLHVARAASEYGALYLRRYAWMMYMDALLRKFAELITYPVEIPPCAVHMTLTMPNAVV